MKRRRVVVAPIASEDVIAILERSLNAFGSEAAHSLDERLDAAIASLDRLSDRGRIVPELRSAGITDYREVVVAPFRIIFRVEAAQVWVVALIDGRRNLEEVLFERVRRVVDGT